MAKKPVEGGDPVVHHETDTGCRFECMRALVDALEQCCGMHCVTDEEHAACCKCQEHITAAIQCHLGCCSAAKKPS